MIASVFNVGEEEDEGKESEPLFFFSLAAPRLTLELWRATYLTPFW